MSTTKVDLGDELLAEIIAVVVRSKVEYHRKVKTLVRAGKIGKCILGRWLTNAAM